MTSTGEGYLVLTIDGEAGSFVTDMAFSGYKLLQARLLVWGALNEGGSVAVEPEVGAMLNKTTLDITGVSGSDVLPGGVVTPFKSLVVGGDTILYETPSDGSSSSSSE